MYEAQEWNSKYRIFTKADYAGWKRLYPATEIDFLFFIFNQYGAMNLIQFRWELLNLHKIYFEAQNCQLQ